MISGNSDEFIENVRKITILRGKYFSPLFFQNQKSSKFPKFQNFAFLKLGELYDSAIFYEQTDRKIDVLQASVPNVRQATQEP